MFSIQIIVHIMCNIIAMSQCSSYRMDSVPCTVPVAHNHQLRTSETQHNSLYSNNTTNEGEKERGRERKEGGKKGRRERGRD